MRTKPSEKKNGKWKQATCENMAMTKIIQLINGRKSNAVSVEKHKKLPNNCRRLEKLA